MKIFRYLILVLISIFSYLTSNAQYSTYCDTLYVDMSDVIKIVESIESKSIDPKESIDVKTCIRVVQSHEMQAVVDFIRVTSSEVIRVEMESLGLDKDSNYYAFVITIDYIPDKSKGNYEAKATEVHK